MKERILEILRAAGGGLARLKIWAALQLPNGRPTDEYWVAEQGLVDGGHIERRRGRGGGIFLVEGTAPSQGEPPTAQVAVDEVPEPTDDELSRQAVEERRTERAHYADALQVLLGSWAKDERFTDVQGIITAGQGRRRTGGRWTRPDLTILCTSKRIFDSARQGDVRTFEVKLYSALDVSAVFEALSHRSRSHYSYLLIVETPERQNDEARARLEGVRAEAARHGVGVWTATNTSDYATWELELDARRSDADPIAIEDFVMNQVPPAERERFLRSLSGDKA